MKNKLLITGLLIVFIATIVYISKDFVNDKTWKPAVNQYKYDLENWRTVHDSLIGYKEINRIQTQFEHLKALAISTDNQLFIGAGNQIVILSKTGEYLRKIGTTDSVSCLFLNEKNEVLVGMYQKFAGFSSEGKLKFVINSTLTESIFTSITANSEYIFIADAFNKVVHKYSITGKFIEVFGKKDSVEGFAGFHIPSPYFDLLIGREDQLWVVNPGMHSMEAFDPKTGKNFSNWSKSSTDIDGFSGCCNPTHIAMLSDGSFVTSEKGLERIKIHAPDGTFKTVVAAPNQFDEGTLGLDLAVDSEDNIYVLDKKRKQIRVFGKK